MDFTTALRLYFANFTSLRSDEFPRFACFQHLSVAVIFKRICEPQPGGSQHIYFFILSSFWLSFILHHHYHFFIISKFIIIFFHFHFASAGAVGKPLSARPSEVLFAQGPISLRQMVPCYKNRPCQS